MERKNKENVIFHTTGRQRHAKMEIKQGFFCRIGLEDFGCVAFKFSNPSIICNILMIPYTLTVNWRSTLYSLPLYSVGHDWSPHRSFWKPCDPPQNLPTHRDLMTFTPQFCADHNFNSPLALPIDCIHPLFLDAVKENTIIYIRAECRLCHCKLGQFVCNRKPDNCDENPRKPCTMANGQLVDGERHSDGCNNCICRNGRWWRDLGYEKVT